MTRDIHNKTKKKERIPSRYGRWLRWITYMIIPLFIMVMGGVGTVIGAIVAITSQNNAWSREDFDQRFSNWSQTSYAFFRSKNQREPEKIDVLVNPDHREMLWEINDMSPYVHSAILSTEDRDFYIHSGFVLSSITRATYQYLNSLLTNLLHLPFSLPGMKNNISGGSTVTQQIIKNTILENRKKTINRKATEILTAARLERYFTKKEIMLLYCNSIYLGKNLNKKHIYGFAAGAKDIFGIPVDQLPLAPAAYLVGMVQSPNRYNPLNDSENLSVGHLSAGLGRMRHVLEAMLDNHTITKQQYQEALNFDIGNLVAQKQPDPPASPHYPFIIEAVQNEAIRILNSLPSTKNLNRKNLHQKITQGGYRIYTTLDKDLHNSLNEAAQNFPAATTKFKNRTLKEKLGSTLIDNKTGSILAFATSNEYSGNDLQNYALYVPRQPGSSMKVPLAYGPAIDLHMISIDSIIDDTPLQKTDSSNNNFYRNYDDRFEGPIPIIQALRESRNIPAVRVFKMVGKKKANEYLKKMNMSLAPRDGEASVLGGLTHGFTVSEMTGAYATIANHGTFQRPHLIHSIVNLHGQEIFNFKKDVPTVPVFSPLTARQLIQMMLSVVNEEGGTGLRTIGIPLGEFHIAGKTGTTNSETNLWFIGCTPEITLGVWSGYPLNVTSAGHTRAMQAFVQLFQTIQSQDPTLSPSGNRWPEWMEQNDEMSPFEPP
ncbi:transglycosylase domain-containing protein [Pasteuria penetrans]|uniref:transglycosylase domain-containing protein n=1 Tax=Pasteuria penetrans TaxID=86005 RepID=UPI000FA361C6|nr:transglycosylase domain-containing protein [Pasteuria penetrans]